MAFDRSCCLIVVSSLHFGNSTGVPLASLESAFSSDGGLLDVVRLQFCSPVVLVVAHLLCSWGEDVPSSVSRFVLDVLIIILGLAIKIHSVQLADWFWELYCLLLLKFCLWIRVSSCVCLSYSIWWSGEAYFCLKLHSVAECLVYLQSWNTSFWLHWGRSSIFCCLSLVPFSSSRALCLHSVCLCQARQNRSTFLETFSSVGHFVVVVSFSVFHRFPSSLPDEIFDAMLLDKMVVMLVPVRENFLSSRQTCSLLQLNKFCWMEIESFPTRNVWKYCPVLSWNSYFQSLEAVWECLCCGIVFCLVPFWRVNTLGSSFVISLQISVKTLFRVFSIVIVSDR